MSLIDHLEYFEDFIEDGSFSVSLCPAVKDASKRQNAVFKTIGMTHWMNLTKPMVFSQPLVSFSDKILDSFKVTHTLRS